MPDKEKAQERKSPLDVTVEEALSTAVITDKDGKVIHRGSNVPKDKKES